MNSFGRYFIIKEIFNWNTKFKVFRQEYFSNSDELLFMSWIYYVEYIQIFNCFLINVHVFLYGITFLRT